ncbi:MAG: lipid A export permease/ATP-binding protein MsbA [Deltaproteobacteria bacterium]|jgi:subfamily B ATP-binding cassette protein MsbA|nr:MAG: lipid A export permease/ATP-binding protein MsbA [Deltaproteobacteria bacterium]
MRDQRTISRLLKYLKPYKGWLATAMACMIVVAVMTAAQAYMVKPMLDEIFFNKDRFMLKVVPLAIVGIFLVQGVFDYSYKYLLEKVGQSVIRDLRNQLYRHIQSLPLSFFHKTPTGELISRIISDVTLIQGAVSNVLVGIIKDSCQIVFLIFVIFYMNWRLSLIAMILLPVIIYPIVNFGRRHRRLSRSNQQTTAHVSNILYETITGTRIVKAFCMEKYEVGRFADTLNKLFSIVMRDTRIGAISHPLMQLFGGIGISLVVWYGGSQVLSGESTPGTFFSFLTALIMIYEPLKGISRVNSTLQQGIAASERVFDVLDVQPDVDEKKDAIKLPVVKDLIEFKDVRFQYDSNTEVLKSINLQVKTGEVLALVGSSGGGKSTLVNLIPRFFDVSSGSLTIDGEDIRDVTLKSLRSQIGIVTQQTILFNDTVRNNIAYGSPDATYEQVKEAARAAHALNFIQELPEGFDTVIGESGARLSGGERQRVSIARAILKNAPILILDEATSSLDTESEREVQQAIENLVQSRTTFVIAHRLSTIRNAHRIIVLQDGRIVEEGTHDSLLPLGGVYKMLYDMQFQDDAMELENDK